MTQNRPAIKIVQGPRKNVEDAACSLELSFHTNETVGAKLFIVADGVGGNRYGEIASRKSIEFICMYITAFLMNIDLHDTDTIKKVIAKALDKTNQQILALQKDDPDLDGMSTTIVLALIIVNTAYIAWAGDSRCYLYNPDRKLQQLSIDHSVTQELIAQGLLDPQSARYHPYAHAITQCIGITGDFAPSIISKQLTHDDILLLCSDGLTDVITARELTETLNQVHTKQLLNSQAVQQLTQLALDKNTTDNATAIIYQQTDPNHKSLKKTTGTYPDALYELFQPVSKEN